MACCGRRLTTIGLLVVFLLHVIGLLRAEDTSASGSVSFSDRLSNKSILADNRSKFQKPYNICTSEWRPFVWCVDIPDQKLFRGYQIDAARYVLSDIGLTEDEYFFNCMDWDPMLEDLQDPEGNCFMAAAGVEISVDNLDAGLKFSAPIYKSGLTLLVKATLNMGTRWGFFEVFHWSLWLILAITGFVVSFLAVLFEKIKHKPRKGHAPGWAHWIWVSLAQLVQLQVDVGMPRTWQARIIFFAYGLTILVMIAMLTATTAARMTQRKVTSPISSRNDLNGKAVETYEAYTDILKRYSIYGDGMPWNNIDDEEKMVDQLRSGKYSALVIDTPWAEFMTANSATCDLMTVGGSFNTWNLGLAYSRDFPTEIVDMMSKSLITQQEMNGMLDKLDVIYMSGNGYCENFLSANAQIGIKQVAGLWLILSAVVGICLLSLIWHFYKHRRARVRQGPEAVVPQMSLKELMATLMHDERFGSIDLSHAHRAGGSAGKSAQLVRVVSQLARDGQLPVIITDLPEHDRPITLDEDDDFISTIQQPIPDSSSSEPSMTEARSPKSSSDRVDADWVTRVSSIITSYASQKGDKGGVLQAASLEVSPEQLPQSATPKGKSPTGTDKSVKWSDTWSREVDGTEMVVLEP